MNFDIVLYAAVFATGLMLGAYSTWLMRDFISAGETYIRLRLDKGKEDKRTEKERYQEQEATNELITELETTETHSTNDANPPAESSTPPRQTPTTTPTSTNPQTPTQPTRKRRAPTKRKRKKKSRIDTSQQNSTHPNAPLDTRDAAHETTQPNPGDNSSPQ